MEKFKSRLKLENLMIKYIKGYSEDKIRSKRLEKETSHILNSPNNNSYNLYDLNKSINSSNYQIRKNLNFNESKSLNNTINSRDSNNNYYFSKNNKNNYSINKKTLDTNNSNYYHKDNSNVYDRLNSRAKTIRKKNFSFDLMSSKELKEMKELEECTFRPKINMYYPTLNNKTYKNSTENDSFDDQNYRRYINNFNLFNFNS
jgi:hypothetical protein